VTTLSPMNPIDRMYKAMEEHCPTISPAEMARRLGVTTARLGNWKARGSIPKDMLAPVAEVLRLNLMWLMTGEGNKAPHVANGFVERFEEIISESQTHRKTIAIDLGISLDTVKKWEKGENLPQGNLQRALAKKLGVSAAWLFYGAGPKEIRTSVIKMMAIIDREGRNLDDILSSIGISKETFYQWQITNIIPSDFISIVAKVLGTPADFLTEDDHMHDILMVPAGSSEDFSGDAEMPDAINASIVEFQQVLAAFAGASMPFTNEIFSKAMEHYLQDEKGQEAFTDYMVDLLAEKLGSTIPRDAMRGIIRDTVQERNAAAHMQSEAMTKGSKDIAARMLRESGIDMEPNVDHIVNDILAELEAKHGKLKGEALEKKRMAIRKDVLSAILNDNDGKNGGESRGEGHDAPRTQIDHG